MNDKNVITMKLIMDNRIDIMIIVNNNNFYRNNIKKIVLNNLL